jgi:Gas vesicle synthesis protein GvpL/GvpF
MTGRVGTGEVMRRTGAAGVTGTRPPGPARRLRPAALSCPSPAPLEPIPAGRGARRVTMAEVSAAPPARGPAGPLGPVRNDVRTGAPYSAAEGARPVTTWQEAEVESPNAPVCYMYGIVPACTRLPDGLRGTGGGRVRLVRHGDLAAVISEIPAAGALGTRADLLAHEHVVASLSARTTMLPLRFSAVVTTADTVGREMLEPYYDWFIGVLADLEGRSEFSVSGTYVQDTVLREVLAEEPEVMRLRENLRGLPEEAGYYDRVRLGELIVHALDAKRQVDFDDLIRSLAPYAVAVARRPPVNEDTTPDAAFLVSDEEQAAFCRAVDELGYRWAGRIRLHLLGPRAPYDFVPSAAGGPWG